MLDGSRNEKDEGDKLRCDPSNTKWLLLQHKHIRIAMSPMLNVVAESGVIRVGCSSDVIRHIVRSQVAQQCSKPHNVRRKGSHAELSRGLIFPFSSPQSYRNLRGEWNWGRGLPGLLPAERQTVFPSLQRRDFQGHPAGSGLLPSQEAKQSRLVEPGIVPIQCFMHGAVENHQLGVRLDPPVHGGHFIKVGMAVGRAGNKHHRHVLRECLAMCSSGEI